MKWFYGRKNAKTAPPKLSRIRKVAELGAESAVLDQIDLYLLRKNILIVKARDLINSCSDFKNCLQFYVINL